MPSMSSRRFIPLTKPHFGAQELREIQKVLDSGWVSQGPKVREFEARVAEYDGVDHAVSVVNCTAALHLSLLALGIKAGDEVPIESGKDSRLSSREKTLATREDTPDCPL